MLDTLKVKLMSEFEEWNRQIDASSEKAYEINMAKEFNDILARNIIHICFGEDLADSVIDLQVKEDDVWKVKQVTIKDSIYIVVG